MELGNYFFGHSRGEYPVPRTDEYEQPIFALIEKITGQDTCYVPEYENETFVMHPYWWGDCKCRFDDQEAEWDKQNSHAPDCFHTLYRQESERLYDEYPQCNFGVEHNHMTKWAKEHGYPDAPNGMAIHCTCGYQERWSKFLETHSHMPDCGLVRPNFLYKPTGYELRVYKYPMRDSFANQDLTPQQFREMMDACIASVKETVVEK